MPCDSYYLEPIRSERELKFARSLTFALGKLEGTVPRCVRIESAIVYASDERSVTELFALLIRLPEQEGFDLHYQTVTPIVRDPRGVTLSQHHHHRKRPKSGEKSDQLLSN